MRPVVPAAAIALLALAACETPREACINEGTRELRTIEALIRETEGNLRRGYAIEEEQEVDVVRDTCIVEMDDGTEGAVRCDRTITRDVERPVAIDLGQERAELASLLETRQRLLSERDARLAACARLPD